MPTVVMLEALAFGLDRLAAAARRYDTELVLLTFDRPYYTLPEDAPIRVVDTDTFDIDAVRRALDGLGKVDGLICNTDTWAPMAETLAAERGFPNVLSGTERLRDKIWVRNRLADMGLSTVRAHRASEGLSTLSMAIVKDAGGTASQHVELAETPEEIDARVSALAAAGVPLERIAIEPYLCGPLYSAETYTTEAGTILFGVSSRTVSELPAFRELDLSYPIDRNGTWEAGIAGWVTKVLEAVGRGTGPSHVEFVDTESGPELVEVNCRLGGMQVGEAIVQATGMDPYELLLLQAIEPGLGELHHKQAREPVTGGFAQVLKYTAATGPLGEIIGSESLASFPGKVRWHAVKRPGSVIASVADQRACYGLVTATGPTPEAALSRAQAAARHVRVAEEP